MAGLVDTAIGESVGIERESCQSEERGYIRRERGRSSDGLALASWVGQDACTFGLVSPFLL